MTSDELLKTTQWEEFLSKSISASSIGERARACNYEIRADAIGPINPVEILGPEGKCPNCEIELSPLLGVGDSQPARFSSKWMLNPQA